MWVGIDDWVRSRRPWFSKLEDGKPGELVEGWMQSKNLEGFYGMRYIGLALIVSVMSNGYYKTLRRGRVFETCGRNLFRMKDE